MQRILTNVEESLVNHRAHKRQRASFHSFVFRLRRRKILKSGSNQCGTRRLLPIDGGPPVPPPCHDDLLRAVYIKNDVERLGLEYGISWRRVQGKTARHLGGTRRLYFFGSAKRKPQHPRQLRKFSDCLRQTQECTIG